MRPEHLTTVYVVRWPDGVTKVGRTIHPQRVRKFEIRGARVDRLIHRTTHATEAELARLLDGLGSPSFRTWQEGVGHLGAGGTGYSECRTLDDASYTRFLEAVDARG